MKVLKSAVLGLAVLVAAPVQAQTNGGPAPAVSEQRRATVTDFKDAEQLAALAAKGKTVVFFYAGWCPNCRATVTELNARWTEVNPELTLVIADYDKEKVLKTRYGVTYQDTFVLLDDKAKGVKSWNSGGVDGLNKNTGL